MADPQNEREGLEVCRRHYEMMATLIATLAAGNGMEVEGGMRPMPISRTRCAAAWRCAPAC